MALTIAVAYGGRQEIADAMQALLREKAKQGEDLETVIEGISQEAIGRYLYAPRSARPRPHHSDQRGDSALGLLALAERLQRILLLRRPLAGLPEGRLPPGRAGVPAARTPPGIIGEGIGRADAWGEDTHASTDAAVRGRPRSPAPATQPSGARPSLLRWWWSSSWGCPRTGRRPPARARRSPVTDPPHQRFPAGCLSRQPSRGSLDPQLEGGAPGQGRAPPRPRRRDGQRVGVSAGN